MPPNPAIPIPSFGTVTPSVDGSPESTNMPTTCPSNDSVVVVRVPARWNVSLLLQLEIGLQHWFRKQGKNATMTMQVFLAVVRKLDWQQHEAPSKSSKPANHCDKHNQLVADLSKEERLMHDLLCVAANPSSKDPLYKVYFDKDGGLKQLQSSVEKLKRLLAQTITLEEAWSHEVSALIRKVVPKKETSNQQENNSIKTASILPKAPSAVITKDMTLEERVHARAKVKQEQQLLKEGLTSSSLSQPLNDNSSMMDRIWMIQLADALWNHATGILNRQNSTRNMPSKLASNSLFHSTTSTANQPHRKKQKTEKTQCIVMTFKDVIQTLSKSRMGETSPVKIAKAISELQTYSPKWISVIFGSSSNSKVGKQKKQSFKWHLTNTTIFIKPEIYKKHVRAQLNGSPASKTDEKQPPISQDIATETTKAEPSRKRASPVAKNLLTDFECAKIPTTNKTDSTVVTHKDKRIKTETDDSVTTRSSKKSLCQRANITARIATDQAAPSLNKKREREVATEEPAIIPKTPSSPPSSPGKHHKCLRIKNRLRINPHHTLMDEDDTGGIVIFPSIDASPNQLRSLFWRLNRGERI
ncbi:expressed unknown protein [Seminavis robusta]|uniref:Uncharacterized protein n=1 Tax=Seminavis robusta TaxID=568900 RepID=A0A9N8ESR9_9STRA|nr:expressed unknown protein [Seminavis robusta]|eukprot:Sro2000_g310190.1 n/a (585) ;mRNA; f:3724-5478